MLRDRNYGICPLCWTPLPNDILPMPMNYWISVIWKEFSKFVMSETITVKQNYRRGQFLSSLNCEQASIRNNSQGICGSSDSPREIVSSRQGCYCISWFTKLMWCQNISCIGLVCIWYWSFFTIYSSYEKSYFQNVYFFCNPISVGTIISLIIIIITYSA